MIKSLQAREPKLNIGDEEFNLYYTQYFGNIKAYVYSYVKDDEVSKDITQNVFTKLYQYRNKLKNDKLKNWLFRVAHNDIMDYFKRNPARCSLDKEKVEPFTKQEPQSIVQQRFEKEVIQATMMKLPRNQRTAILLKDVKGYSYEEIAKTLNLSYGAVKSLIFRGRQKFIKLYREVKDNEMY